MHLGLRAPNIWFRARLRYPDPRAVGGRVDAGGFTLPGLPALVVGSNGQVAWGFTNSYGDWLDWQREPACTAPCPGVTRTVEHIRVAGQADVEMAIDETAWGPIVHRESDGSGLALRWVAHLPGSMNLGLADFLHAHTLDDALKMADHTAIPGQNLAIGDRNGRITWRLLGPVPQRQASCAGHDRERTGGLPAVVDHHGVGRRASGRQRATGLDRKLARRRRRTAGTRRRRRLRQRRARARRSATTCSRRTLSTNATCWRSSSTIAPCS